MLKVSKDSIVYAMSADNAPALHADPGSQILIEEKRPLQTFANPHD